MLLSDLCDTIVLFQIPSTLWFCRTWDEKNTVSKQESKANRRRSRAPHTKVRRGGEEAEQDLRTCSVSK